MLQPGRKYTNGNGYRYGFNGQEVETENQFQDFDMRMYDPRLGKFLSVDPLAGSLPWNSTYAFAENRVIEGKEYEGMEVVLVNKNKDEWIYNVGMRNTDKSAVHIYTHSTPSTIMWAEGKWTNSDADFKAALNKSDVYKNANTTDRIVVILHSCRAGRSYFDENGNYIPSVAEQLSASNKNLTIIAPDERDNFSAKREVGPKQILHPRNKRADYALDENGNEMKGNSTVNGNWNLFENGKWVGQFDQDYDPASAPNAWDYTFNYKQVDISISASVGINNLNLRSNAGYGKNIIKKLAKGTEISLTGKTSGGWSEVEVQGSKGWVATEKIKKNIIVQIEGEKKK